MKAILLEMVTYSGFLSYILYYGSWNMPI